jgi:hypothetical protein
MGATACNLQDWHSSGLMSVVALFLLQHVSPTKGSRYDNTTSHSQQAQLFAHAWSAHVGGHRATIYYISTEAGRCLGIFQAISAVLLMEQTQDAILHAAHF